MKRSLHLYAPFILMFPCIVTAQSISMTSVTITSDPAPTGLYETYPSVQIAIGERIVFTRHIEGPGSANSSEQWYWDGSKLDCTIDSPDIQCIVKNEGASRVSFALFEVPTSTTERTVFSNTLYVTTIQGQCDDQFLQGANNMETCVAQSGCYYDDKSYEDLITQTCFDTRHPCEEEVDANGRTTVWGYSHEWFSEKARSLAEDSCEGSTRTHVSCGSDGFIVQAQEICPNGCGNGVCVPSIPTLCGNGRIDAGEECDSGKMNADLSRAGSRGLASFCSNQCRFYWYQDKQVPVQCQLMDSDATAKRDISCTARFGSLESACVIRAGMHTCDTLLRLPLNYDVLFYQPHLTGSVEGGSVVNTAYNGTNYYLNIRYGLSSSSVSSTSSSSSSRPGVPPAGYEDEVLINFEQYGNPFPDTDMNMLSGKAAAELYRRAVIGGFPDGEFKGDRLVNRAEAAKFLLLSRFGSIEDISNDGRFPDVLDQQWYTTFVMTAAEKGIISGYPDGTFRPADTVNTAEFLKMIGLTFMSPESFVFNPEENEYRDVSADDWFAPYTHMARADNLFPDRTTYLYPERPLTRAEVAVAIYQYLKNR